MLAWTLTWEFDGVVVRETLRLKSHVSHEMFSNYSLVVNVGVAACFGI